MPETLQVDVGRVYVYRPDSPSIVGIAEVPFVYRDDQPVGRLCKGCFVKFPVTRGVHTIKIVASFLTAIPAYELARQAVDAGPGEAVFLKYVANVDKAHTFGPQPPITRFERIDPAAGRRDINGMHENK